MAFQLILTTAPTPNIGNVSLWLRFSTQMGLIGEATTPFLTTTGTRGTVFGIKSLTLGQAPLLDFNDVWKHPDTPALSLDVEGRLNSGNQAVNFFLNNLSSNDTLHMIAFSREIFLGNIVHRMRGLSHTLHAPRCVATCADGTSGQGCVTCVQGPITVKICC